MTIAPPAPTRRRRHPLRTAALPLGLLTVAFLAFALPPYLGLDPARARLPLPSPVEVPWFYPALVAHIGFGTVALLTATMQVWPWLRRRHPGVHRWSGRAYLALGVLPGGVAVLFVAPFALAGGPTGQVANSMLGILWLVTGVAGWRAARARRYAEHREWMLRSVALTFSIVANRFWSTACVLFYVPGILDGAEPDPAMLAQAVGVSTWLSWVVNLLVMEWWLQRGRRLHAARAGSPRAGSRSARAP